MPRPPAEDYYRPGLPGCPLPRSLRAFRLRPMARKGDNGRRSSAEEYEAIRFRQITALYFARSLPEHLLSEIDKGRPQDSEVRALLQEFPCGCWKEPRRLPPSNTDCYYFHVYDNGFERAYIISCGKCGKEQGVWLADRRKLLPLR